MKPGKDTDALMMNLVELVANLLYWHRPIPNWRLRTHQQQSLRECRYPEPVTRFTFEI